MMHNSPSCIHMFKVHLWLFNKCLMLHLNDFRKCVKTFSELFYRHSRSSHWSKPDLECFFFFFFRFPDSFSFCPSAHICLCACMWETELEVQIILSACPCPCSPVLIPLPFPPPLFQTLFTSFSFPPSSSSLISHSVVCWTGSVFIISAI